MTRRVTNEDRLFDAPWPTWGPLQHGAHYSICGGRKRAEHWRARHWPERRRERQTAETAVYQQLHELAADRRHFQQAETEREQQRANRAQGELAAA